MRLSIDESAFFSSVKANDLSSVKQALRFEPCLVDFQDEIGKTPLHLAVESGLPDMVKLLISSSAKLGIVDNEGNAPIHLAIKKCLQFDSSWRKNFLEIANIFLESGIDINVGDKTGFSPLHHAAISGDKELALFFIEKGADVNHRSRTGYTPLHWGLCANISKRDIPKHLDALETLIKYGADVNAKTDDGKTSLLVALENNPGHPELGKLLQKYSAK